ncbi:MAG: ABC transporter permease [Candidatus Bathyarchaeia archaeon]
MTSVIGYIVKRFSYLIFLFLFITTVTFVILRSIPGDPTYRWIMEGRLTQQEREALIKTFGLDKPLIEQFFIFIVNIFRGELGISYSYYPSPVIKVILERLPWTILLMGTATVLSMLIGMIIAPYISWHEGTKKASIITDLCFISRTIPSFWVGMILLLIFGYYLRVFPLSGAITIGLPKSDLLVRLVDVLWHMVLPVVTLSLYYVPGNILVVKASFSEVLPEEFMLTARAKGLSKIKLLYKHAFRAAIIPILTWFTLQIGYIVSGAVIIEVVFSYPGLGRLLFEAVFARDYTLLQGAFLMLTLTMLCALFIIDVFILALDPRTRR